MARYKSLDPNKYILIREAAIELFYKQGINKTSMQEIANEAGIAKGTIYLYYKSKQKLVDHVFKHCLNLHLEASMKNVENLKTSSQKLKERLKNILIWNSKNPKESSVARLYYKPVNIVGTDNVAFTKSYDINKNFLQEGIERGEFKDLPIEFLCRIFFSSVEGMSNYVRENPEILKEEDLLDEMLETIIAGFSK